MPGFQLSVSGPGAVLLRRQILASAVATGVAALLFWISDFPNGRYIVATSLASSAAYLFFYVFFNTIYKRLPDLTAASLSAMAVLVLASTVHFSGGVASPFVFLYFCILISEAVYGMDNPVTLPLSIATYVGVCAAEYSGLLVPANHWADTIYKNRPVVALLVSATVCFMWLTRHITGLIIANLRESLARENSEKESLLQKFSALDSTTQIGVLAHRIAHDLRGPMSSISGYIQLEMVKERDSESAAALAEINSMVDNMTESLRNITSFGKSRQVPPERIRLSEFVRNLLAVIAYSPYYKGVEIRKLYSEDLPAAVLVSRADLQQACFNILKNAVEAVANNPGGKLLELDLRVSGSDVQLIISDNGPGMPEELLKNAGSKSVTTKKGGTGVGLMITRDLVVRNGGDLKMRNREEGGMAVTVRLPLAV